MLKIMRPSRVAVEIFGKEYDLRRLSLGDVMDMADTFAPVISAAGETLAAFLQLKATPGSTKGLDSTVLSNAILTAIHGCNDGFREVLRRSFPDFSDWGAVDFSSSVELLNVVWETNDVRGIWENFFTKVREAIAKGAALAPEKTTPARRTKGTQR